MIVFCTRCGSTSHLSYDCSKPDQRLTPPTIAADTKDAPEAVLEPRKAIVARGPILEPARYPGGPQICAIVNLPSFKSDADLRDYLDRHVPISGSPSKVWTCKDCGGWHFEFKPTRPAYPPNFRPRVPKRAAVESQEPDLPRREARAVENKPVDTKPRKAQQSVSRRDGDLF